MGRRYPRRRGRRPGRLAGDEPLSGVDGIAVRALLVLRWPAAAIGFGMAFGLGVALVLDDLLVPAFGWGPWPWRTPLATHAYGLSSHLVFGLVLESVRRLVATVLA